MASPFDVNFAPFRLPSVDAPVAPKPAGLDTSVPDFSKFFSRSQPPKAAIYYSPSQRKYAVGDKIVAQDDEAGLVQAAQSTDLKGGYQSPGGDFQSVDPQSFSEFIGKITNPDLGRRFGKNFESGAAGLGELAGAGLSFLGAKDLGQNIMQGAETRQQQLSPYNMGLEDINGSPNHGIVDWFVGMLGQFGPTMVESAVTAAIGAGVGAVAGGGADPLTALGGALAGWAGKQEVKAAVIAAAKKYAEGEALSGAETSLLQKQGGLLAAALEKNPTLYGTPAGEVGTGAQVFGPGAKLAAQDLLKAGRGQAIAGGAALTSAANSYATGVSDLYREQLTSGDPNAPNLGVAAGLAVPYAALDLLPEFLLARRIFGSVGADGAKKLAETITGRGKALQLLKRGVKGAVVGAASEGLNEGGQEALLILANPLVDLNSPQGISRVLNAFAGGAAVGGLIGGFANLSDSEHPVDALDPVRNAVNENPEEPPQHPTQSDNPTTPNLPVAPTSPVAASPEYGQFTESPQQQNALALPAPPPPNPILARMQQGQGNANFMGSSTPNFATPDVTFNDQIQPFPYQAYLPPAETFMQPATSPGQPFTRLDRAPALKAGQAFSRQAPPPNFGTDAQGQYQMFPPGQAALRQQAVPVTSQESSPSALGQYGPSPQGDLFGAERFPMLELPNNQIKAASVRIKNSVLSWLNSLENADIAKLEPVFGNPEAIYNAVKTSRVPRELLAQMRSVLNNARSTGKVVALKNGKPRAVQTPTQSNEPNPPEPPKPKKGVPKKPKSLNAQGKSLAPKATMVKATKAETKVAHTEVNHVRELIDDADTGSVSAVEQLHFLAHATAEDEIDPAYTESARKYLQDTQLSKRQQEAIDKLNGITAPKEKPTEKSWWNPEERPPKATTNLTSTEKLTNYLNQLISDPAILNDRVQRLMAQGKAKGLYAAAKAVHGESKLRAMAFNGKSIGDYFTSGGQLNIQENTEDETFRLADDADQSTGRFHSVENGTPHMASSMEHGSVKLKATTFMSRLKNAPRLHVFRNMQDFKTAHPSLYAQAKAARGGVGYKAGTSFDEATAAGYSFGDHVVVFSDYIKNEQHLRTVLAHEALGHYGLRAIMSQGELNATLDDIYRSWGYVRSYVDRMVEARGVSRQEATEEFLADYAAYHDASLIRRIWARIKDALNRIGIKFDDDAARYVISQAGRYVREGDGKFFSARTMLERMAAMQQDADEGRFSPADEATMSSQWVNQAHITNNILHGFESFTDFWRQQRVADLARGEAGGLRAMLGRAAEQVQTLNNIALRSEGVARIFDLLQGQSSRARKYFSDMNGIIKESHKLDTKAEHRTKAGVLNAYAALARQHLLDDEALSSYNKLIDFDPKTGKIEINQQVFDQMEKDGLVGAQDFLNGLKFSDARGAEHTLDLAAHGITAADLKDDAKVWKMYLEHRKAVNLAALRVLASNYEQLVYQTQHTMGTITSKRTTNPFNAVDRRTLKEIMERYQALRKVNSKVLGNRTEFDAHSIQQSEEFLKQVTRAFDNDAILKQWLDNATTEDVPDAFKTKEFQSIRDGLQSLYDKGVVTDQRYEVQALLRDLALYELQVEDAERYAAYTILGSYTPFKRRGRYQVHFTAYDGRSPVRLLEELRSTLAYYRTDSFVEAQEFARELSKLIDPEKQLELRDFRNVPVNVKLKAEISEARNNSDFADIVNLNEFLFVAERLGVQFNPEARERLTIGLTNQNAKARSNLMRSGSPGWDPNVLRSIAEYLETQSHVAAKRVYRLRIRDTLDRQNLWLGDDEKLAGLKAAVDTATTEAARARARREYERYAYQYKYMKAQGNSVDFAGKKFPTLGYGNRYHDMANNLIDWMGQRSNIQDSTEDMLQGPLASRLKTAFVAAQLGGTVATAAVNAVSMVTHSIPTLAFYNSKEAFGYGFGLGKSTKAMFDALTQVGNPVFGNVEKLQQMLKDGSYTKAGLSKDEVQFLLNETENGIFQAAQYDALLGTARGKITNPIAQKSMQAWMWMFSYTERLNRRTTGLAAYRLEKERALAEGLNERDAIDSAEKAARKAVTDTQGEYGMINRPKAARGNLLSLVFMYKMFPILTVQLIRHLPWQGRVFMLGSLLALAGMKGLPFADDLMDILDTIFQKLGLKQAPVEAQLYKFFDGVSGGHGQEFMRGALDQFSGETFSTRFSVGDMIPMTGAFKAGADLGREATQFLGPMAGGLFGSIGQVGSIMQMASAPLTGRPGPSIVDVLRESPVALARALGDTLAYSEDGAVVNQQGRLISPNVDAATLIWRLLGFYPASATRANDFTRIGKQQVAYKLELTTAFKNAYVKAALANQGRGDQAAMQAVLNSVHAWNEAAKGSGFEISDFLANTQKAIKAAQRPAGERFLKTTPLSSRDQMSEWMTLYGAQ